MKNLSPFCTCTDLKCPLHPTNHERGCAPCIANNLKSKEIPSCFFRTVMGEEKPDAYYYEDFAKAVLSQKCQPGRNEESKND